MKRILLFVSALSGAISLSAQTVYSNYQDGKIWFRVKSDYRILSSLKEDPSKLPVASLPFLNAVQSHHSIQLLSRPFSSAKDAGLQRTYQLQIGDLQNVDQVISEIVASGAVEYAEKVPLDKVVLTPNDPSYSSQWGLAKISAPTAWNSFSTGSTIVVAIVDDAVERTHPDLSPNLWVNTGDNNTNGIDDDGNGYIDDRNGWDVSSNDNNPNPPNSSYDHGTHVAGIVGAASNNSTGVASIGYSVKLMCIKASSSPGSVNDGYAGIVYAVDNGADVINMSWGGYTSSTTAQNIINYAHNNGVVLVAAAGNDNVSTILYPAGYTNVISVAASSSNDAKASFSNYGSWIDVTAPGENIYSTTVGASYGNKSGTSMASPMVAGLAGLMLSLNPSLTPADIENCIKNNTDNINAMNGSYLGQLGTGRINANLAMQCIAATLNWAPVADFAANFTTVTAGGSVNFTNLSLYNPTSYSWSFQGGTPATSTLATPPSITYSTPGTYSVSLTATNANGSDVETKTAYIVVSAASGCQKINLPAPTGWTATQYYTGATVGQDGWVNGVNVYGDKEKAMFFDASASPYTMLTNVWIGFGEAYSGNSAKIVPVKIYDGTGTTPGTLLGTVNTTMGQIMSDVQGGYYTEIDFTNSPVTLPASKRFFVSVDLTNLSWTGSPKDTLSIVSNTNGQTTPSAIYDKDAGNVWAQYGTAGTWNLNASLYIHPWLTDQPANATFTQTATSICQGNTINFDATGSTYQDTLLWYFPGGTPVISNNLTQTVNFNTPGTYDAILYVIGGGCSQFDSSFVSLTILANPTISVTSSSTTLCPAGSATLTATGGTSYAWAPPAGLSAVTGASVVATPTASTQYNVTATGANGCTNTSTIQITLQPLPVANLSSMTATGCQNSTFSYDGSLSTDVTNFTWTLTGGSPASSSTPAGTTTYTAAGTYTVNLDVSNSCGTNSTSTVVTINPQASPVITAPSPACVGDLVTFDGSSSTNTSSYAWTFTSGTPSSGSGSTSATTYGTAGTYTVTLDGTNSCGTVSTNTTITINSCVGINEVSATDLQVVYNPQTQQNTIYFPENAYYGNYAVQLYNELGQVIFSSSVEVNAGQRQFTVEANNLSSGIYFVSIRGNGLNAVKKFVR